MIYTIYVHCPKIHNLFERALETGKSEPLANFSSLFRSEYKLIFISNDTVRKLLL